MRGYPLKRTGNGRRAVITLVVVASFLLAALCPEQYHGRRQANVVAASTEQAGSNGRVVVRLEEGSEEPAISSLISVGLEPVKELSLNMWLCEAPAGYQAASLQKPPGVLWMEDEVTFRAAATSPNDPDYPKQWNLEDIKAEEAWAEAGGGDGSVVVAVLDSGAAYRDSETGPRAPDLANTHFVDGYDIYGDDPYPDDEHGHGTLITEVLASSFNNSMRAAGIAYGCSVMPVRVLGPDAAADGSIVAEGIVWAADNGARVICLAMAATRHSEAVGEAVKYAYDKGVLCIAAAGNEGSFPGYPGGMDCPADEGAYVLAVGATDLRETRAHYSNYGEDLDLVAPGGDLTRDDNLDGYPDGVPQETFRETGVPQGGFALTWNEGTSMAVPQVAATAAILLSSRGDLSPSQLSNAITSTCRDLGEAGRDDYYGFGMLDMDAALSAQVSSQWYFAEGTTQEGFDQWFCVANPNSGTARVQFTFYQEDGTSTTSSYQVPGLTRFTLSANQVVGLGLSFATSVESDLPVVAERPMYFDYHNGWTGGSAVLGARELSETWYFAEGYTQRDLFDTYICMLNPWPDDAQVSASFFLNNSPTGVKYINKTYTVPHGSRLTLNLNEQAAYDSEISTMIVSSLPIVAERPMYFDYKSKWTGGHDVVGATSPSNQWYFAEGTTRAGFETWLCLANTGGEGAVVTVDYLLGEGQGPNLSVDYNVPANSRFTVNVNEEAGPEKDVSLKVSSTHPVVAERPMYFSYGEGAWNDGHDVVGAAVPSSNWSFAEGTTRQGFDTWLCLANPGDGAAQVTVTYMLGEGQGDNVVCNYEVGPGTRYTIKVNDEVGQDKDVSMKIESTQPVVAERPMYFLYGGAWDGGHDVVGNPGV